MFSLFTQIMWDPWVCKTDQGQGFANFQYWSLLRFCKMPAKGHFPFLYLLLFSLCLKQQRQHENTNIIEEQYVNYFQPCQESLELRTGASGVMGFDDSFCLSVCLLCFVPDNPSVLFPAPSPLWALPSERALIFLPVASTHWKMWNFRLY